MEKFQLPKLNLPPIEARIEEDADRLMIWDVVRKKLVALTPEEWVRQHFIHLLIHHLEYPASLFKIEKGLTYNRMIKRSDIEVFDRQGKLFLLVECKAPEVSINQTTLKQAGTYNSKLKAPFLAITNGMKHHLWEFHSTGNSYTSRKEFPDFPD